MTLQQDGIAVRDADSSGLLAGAAWAARQGDHYGLRLRGSLTAPITGDYTLFVAGDDNASLYLSSDHSRFHKQLIAWSHRWTAPTQWDKYSSQRSKTIRLQAGETYYIEALMKELTGGDHLSIGWSYEAPQSLQELAVGGTVTQTWSATDGGYALEVEGGDIWGTSDRFGFKYRTWTGDGEFVARVKSMNNPYGWAKVGVMLRASLDADSAQASMLRSGSNGMAFQRRVSVGAGSAHTGYGQTWEWVKLRRQGDQIKGYISQDGTNWVQVGKDTLSALPDTVYVGIAATDNVGANPVLANVGALSFQPLTASELIPASHLRSLVADANDLNDDGLPDDWAEQHGITVASGDSPLNQLGEYGDFDHDGISNFREYQLDTDPTRKEALMDGLSRERWETLSGTRITDLTHGGSRFLLQPDERKHVAQIHEFAHGDQYASRYRGTVTAPVSGEYTFWISGDDEAELWLADGSVEQEVEGVVSPMTNRYGKQKIAWIQDQRFGQDYTSDEDFDRFPSQQSRSVSLQAGQAYYIEVLHKENLGGDHVAVAWQVPGQGRELIPSSAFSSDVPEDDDTDDDNLPAAWEIQYGLNPDDNGLTDARDGQYGDWDGDGLTNFEECQLGTDPTVGDTDGDGLSDREERDYYGSDPLVSNQISSTLHTRVELEQFQDTSNAWSRDDEGALVCSDSRGVIEYQLIVAPGEEGLFEVMITGGASGSVRSTETLPLDILINQVSIGKLDLLSENGGSSSVQCLTPWLKAGSYTLAIHHVNYLAALRLRLDEVTVTRLGGIDSDSNGIADWMDAKFPRENRIVHLPLESATSPLCVEAATSAPTFASLSRLALDTQTGLFVQQPHVWQEGIDNGLFADVPLHVDGPTEIRVDFQHGAVSESRQVTWTATNMLEADGITIRKGDALKLTAWSGDAAEGSFTLSMNGQPLADQNGHLSYQSNSPLVLSFDTAGTVEFEASWRSADGNINLTSPFTVTVLEADFGGGIDLMAWNQRHWTIAGLGPDVLVQADSRLGWLETSAPGSSPREFDVNIYDPADYHVLARLPDGGGILARGEVRGMYIASVAETGDASLSAQYDDGTWLMRMSYVAENLPPNAVIRLRSYHQGTVFMNGGNVLDLTAEDFDENGVAIIFMEWANGTSQPKLCHYVDVLLVE
ncbi:PA14 domain-containing protein [Oceaniferula marina]|uniref:PA14 domain-containing protein n=1 Tax=Oceaniferula marina TaxID=2748318 RepID=UPI0015BB4705|nr:PA14 domain-containing protein [Oceaniferula marina]